MSSSNDIQIDPRGYRFGALITFVLATASLAFGPTTTGIVLAFVLTALFVPGAVVGPQLTLQSFLFRNLIRPRIGPPEETESLRPPRFAQQMGLAMSLAGFVLGLLGVGVGFYVFFGMVTVASFLNGIFGYCLGCEIYLLFKRATTKAA